LRAKTPTPSALGPADGGQLDTNLGNNFSLVQRFERTGGIGVAAFDNSRINTNNPFSALAPYLQSRLSFNYTQALFRNRKTDALRTEIKVRTKNVDISRTDLEVRVIDVIGRVQDAYWTLVAARQDVVIADDFRRLVTTQLALNKRLIDAGTLARIELAASEAELQRRNDTFQAALNQVTVAENNLKTLLNAGREQELWNQEIIPSDETIANRYELTALRDLVDGATQRRPELKGIGQRGDIVELQRQLALEQRKPQFDLTAGYALTGLAGQLNSVPNPFANLNTPIYDRLNRLSVLQGLQPVVPPPFGGPNPSFLGNYGTNLGNLFGGSFNTVQAGLSVDLNLRNRTADANLATAEINQRRLKLQRQQTEQLIEAQVRNSLQAVESAKQRIQAAEASVKAASEKLASETRLFETGESTNFLVLTRQSELNDSRRRLLLAQLERNRALLLLERSLGDTLTANRINVD
jgi:outer membrane protein TolC